VVEHDEVAERDEVVEHAGAAAPEEQMSGGVEEHVCITETVLPIAGKMSTETEMLIVIGM
jgi:hypothetical protein